MKLVRHGRRSFGVAHTRVGVGALLTASRRGAVMLALGSAVLFGCDDDALAPRPMDAPAPFGLSAEQATTVLAKVGDRTITLGDYALLLERMNEIDRSRYQSKKRRRDLLQEMIDIELLAQEAKRRGLDRHPEVQDAVRQILRDAMRAKIHETVRSPGRIGAEEVKAYYDAHPDEFHEPERRRVSAIVLGDPEKAAEVLEAALAITDDKTWGELFFEHSLTAPKARNPNDPPDLAGSLDMVGPPGDPKSMSSKVPAEVQKAVFTLAKVGDVYGSVVAAEGRHYVVRLSGIAEARTRTLEMADRAIRVKIFQKEQREAEDKAVAELKKELSIQVFDEVVGGIRLPDALKDYKPFWEQTPSEDVAPEGLPTPAPAEEPTPAPSAAPAASAQPAER